MKLSTIFKETQRDKIDDSYLPFFIYVLLNSIAFENKRQTHFFYVLIWEISRLNWVLGTETSREEL